MTDRTNNFGFLRLLFATLVIVSHSPEVVDGNRSREILTRLFGTMSFGEVAVDGFFLISGYLITQSFVRSESPVAYLVRRVLRIVPGYGVSFLLCVVLVTPFVRNSGVLSFQDLKQLLPDLLTLSPPGVEGVFTGLPYPMLNGAMWTIAYEFRCYLATAILGLLGLYSPRHRMLLLMAVAVLLALNATGAIHGVHIRHELLLGVPENATRFAAVFGVGAIYYLFRDRIPLTDAGAAIAAPLLVGLMFDKQLAETAYAVLGGYLILWFAFKVRVLWVSRLAPDADISYGLYLYGWPIQTLIIWNDRTINPWVLCCLSLLVASLMGYVSWSLVEKPCLRLARGRRAVLALP
jgi:peptidoglycan/LPS O-acetylase OafA/YrhL